jgi:ribosome maturation factor RimP
MTTTPVPAALASLIEPLVAEAGLDLYDLERSGPVVRVIVDLPAERRDVPVVPADKDGAADNASEEPLPPSVGIAEIARLTRSISRAIDEHDPMPSAFTLEVSSPGLERNLRTPLHFSRSVGEAITVKTISSYDGPRRLNGTLVAADDAGIDLQVDDAGDGPLRIAYGDIDKARTTFEWAAQPKRGGKQSQPGGKQAKRGSKQAKPGPKSASQKTSPKKKAS